MSKHSAPLQDWPHELLNAENISPADGWQAIYEAMDRLAGRAAPVARTTWNWIVALQGLCVLMPLLWLLRSGFHWDALVVAVLVLVVLGGLLAAFWWLRWRGMQHTWARARLLAEVARASITAEVTPAGRLHVPALAAVPGVTALLAEVPAVEDKAALSWPEWSAEWSRLRMDDQMAFYAQAGARAEAGCRAFSRWSTVLMDLMLTLGVSGLILGLTHRSPRWLRLLGEENIAAIAGLGGAALALCIILIQVLRSMQEVNRRAARFARQHEMLRVAKLALAAAPDEAAARQIMQETESQLLGEVVDWYFEAETAERFFEIKANKHLADAPNAHATATATATATSRPAWRLVLWGLVLGGSGLLFIVRVVLGRAPYVACSCALTLGWLAYQAPADAESRQWLSGNGQLRDRHGEVWQPDPSKAEHGCVVIAHGLHDGAFANWHGDESRWMREMAAALEQRLIETPPNITLVDWNSQAMPAELNGLHFKNAEVDRVLDVCGIRPQAREVGDFLAFRLAQWLHDGRIRRDRPLHLIGHSAGGFVVARAALILRKINMAPKDMQVTLLDTPGPDADLTVNTPQHSQIDFYVTSPFVLGVSEAAPPAGIHVKEVPPDQHGSPLDAHSYAWKWYNRTIPQARAGEHGFGRSPLLRVPGG